MSLHLKVFKVTKRVKFKVLQVYRTFRCVTGLKVTKYTFWTPSSFFYQYSKSSNSEILIQVKRWGVLSLKDQEITVFPTYPPYTDNLRRHRQPSLVVNLVTFPEVVLGNSSSSGPPFRGPFSSVWPVTRRTQDSVSLSIVFYIDDPPSPTPDSDVWLVKPCK